MSRRPHQQAPPQNSQEESMALRVNAIRRYLYRVNSRYQKVAPPRRDFLSFMGSSFFDKLFLAQKAQYLVHEPPHRGLLRTRKIDPASCFLSSFIRLVWTPHQGRICPTRTFPTSAPPCSLRSYRGAALAKWRQSTELHINSELASMVRFLLVV